MKEKRLTLKQQRWVEKTVETLNPTEAARQAYEIKGGEGVAKEIASENLAKPYLQEAIKKEMTSQGITLNWLVDKYKRNAGQEKNLPASNAMLDIINKIFGLYSPEESKSIHLNINLNDPAAINSYLATLNDELRSLTAQNPDS